MNQSTCWPSTYIFQATQISTNYNSFYHYEHSTPLALFICTSSANSTHVTLCTNLPARRNRTLDLCTTPKRLCMSLYVFAAVFLTASTWHREKFVVQLCHGELPMFFWILTEEYPPNPKGQVIWEWRGEIRQDFKGLCEPQKWRVKLSSITTVATALNFRRNRSTNVHDLQDVSSTEVLAPIRGGLCWP